MNRADLCHQPDITEATGQDFQGRGVQGTAFSIFQCPGWLAGLGETQVPHCGISWQPLETPSLTGAEAPGQQPEQLSDRPTASRETLGSTCPLPRPGPPKSATPHDVLGQKHSRPENRDRNLRNEDTVYCCFGLLGGEVTCHPATNY